ncbi:unnamed protein product, partial [Mesorhabditis belari]|uniref:SSD domain-containing protein n=1 Tax=Mesorhabditis belari TaxID=2138241 RepID=A0AAF3J5C9_9BILA
MEYPVGAQGLKPRRPSILIGQRSLDAYQPEEGGNAGGTRFVRWVISIYSRWGFIIAKYAWWMIFICLTISGLSLWKIVTTPQQNDITGYTPYGARANDEYEQYQKFFSAEGLPIATYIFAVAKDNGSMIRESHLQEVVEVMNFVYNNITMYNSEEGKYENFQVFCKSFCQINEPVRQYYNGYIILKDQLANGEELNSRIKLQYPITEMMGQQFSLQPNFFGIEKFGNDEMAKDKAVKLLAGDEASTQSTAIIQTNSSIDDEAANAHLLTNLKSVKMIALQFRAEHRKGWTDQEIKEWELKVVDIFQKKHPSNRIKLFVMSQSYIETEMVRGGKIMLPFLVVGFTIMCAVSVVTVSVRAWYMNQTNCYKIVLAVMACLTPILACTTALALMFIVGVRFASILCVIPFLVLSIGVDSSYLMLHEWQRVTKHARENPKKKDSVGHRMSEVLSEVGPAILISCLTNMFADFVGSFTSSYEITLLCTGNMLSMWFAFIYQLTFYAGLMSIVGRYEIDEDKSETQMAVNIAEQRVNIARHRRSTLQRQPSKFHEVTKPIASTFFTRYVNIICAPVTYFSIVGIYFLYLAISVWGITQININLTASKLFAADSPLVQLDNYRVKYQVPYYSMATVFVSNPGNLSEPERLKKMNQFVQDFEHLPGSWGPVGTKYFARDFQRFLKKYSKEEEDEDGVGGGDDQYDDSDYEDDDKPINFTDPSYVNPMKYKEKDMAFFINWPEYEYWKGFIKLKNSTRADGLPILDRFFFTAGFRGDQLKIWINRGKMLQQWRDVVDKYPEFQPSVYHEDGVYLDLIDNMPTDTWQSVLGTLVCMAAVCFIFLNSWFTVAIASLSVLSICCGILGILSWWGIDLDPITMAAMIISIGFSVDIPAHVAYHYYQAAIQGGPNATPADRLANCLSSVAFPALQAAFSTILCVLSLCFVHIYMAEVFVKTMILCVLLCNFHGLLFLPAILITLDELRGLCRPKSVTQQSSTASRSTHSRENKQRGRNAPETSKVTDRPEV